MSSTPLPHTPGPIGVFDSGYGGLTILDGIRRRLPQYDYLYLGDNARAPYGFHSFEVVYRYTLQAVKALFSQGCHLVILACNTASAKALRTIQQNDLEGLDPTRRVLGVIRPTVEAVGQLTRSRHVGILGTEGTIRSESYNMEIRKLNPDITVSGMACPMWVPLVENNEYNSPGADYFVKKRIDGILQLDPLIDTLILGCTHYPLLKTMIGEFMGQSVTLVDPAKPAAHPLEQMLSERGLRAAQEHEGQAHFYVSDVPDSFVQTADLFLGEYKGGPVDQIAIDKY